MVQRVFIIILVLLALTSGLHAALPPLQHRGEVSDEVLASLMAIARSTLHAHQGNAEMRPGKRPASDSPLAAGNGVRVVFLKNGRQIGAGEAEAATLSANARAAAVNALMGVELSENDAITCLVEVFLPERKAPDKPLLLLPKWMDAGRKGFRLIIGDDSLRVPASEMVITGKTASSYLESSCKELGHSIDNLVGDSARITLFDCVLILGLPGEAHRRLYRNSLLVKLEEVNAEALRAALERAKEWYLAHQHEDGALPYSYRPNSDRYSNQGNLLIRRLFGTAAIGTLQKALADEEVRTLGLAALTYELDRHYLESPREAWGYIRDDKTVQLGNAAAALCALIRLGNTPEHSARALKLANFITSLRQADGSYKTYYYPSAMRGGQEYYPGEAQLALMELYEVNNDKALVAGVRKSFEYYRSYWRNKPSTPFIPWHTQAYVKLYRATREAEIAEFVFEMNDLLISIQERGRKIPDDCKGRFLNPERRLTGYPHVSSTGVYLEGLVDAFALAREKGEVQRENDYRTAIIWGLRNLLQMQVKGKYDTWCMPDKARSIGGFRSRWDYSSVRVDNQQHCVIAISKALATLTPEDYIVVQREGE